MTPIKLVIVEFASGSRGDFVAGWLGKLPKFVESYWSFNPISGQSVSMTQHRLHPENKHGLTTFLKDLNFILDPTAEFSYATGVHASVENHPAIKILKISLTNVDVIQLNWERIIKVYTRYHVGYGWYIDRMIKKNNISNSDRIYTLHKLLTEGVGVQDTSELRAYNTGIEYNDLFCPGGSYHVTNALEIDVDTKYHEYWDYMLPLAHTPSEISNWGHIFRKKDYITG